MCLAIPARLVELLPGEQAIVNLGGIRKTVSIALIDDAQVDDYVIVHVGHAIGKIDPEEAARTLALFGELAQAQAESDALSAAAKAPA
jgi:hydrogenase expression/formation protein HypC